MRPTMNLHPFERKYNEGSSGMGQAKMPPNSRVRYKLKQMTAQEVRTHIGYSGWASRKVLEAALALPPEDRAKPMSVSHESIANTLAHIYFGDAIWFADRRPRPSGAAS